MCHQTLVGPFLAIVGLVVLMDPDAAYAQIEGAVQYPPVSMGEDAQPPPPARMAPRIASPRRLELGTSGSSLPPRDPPYWILPAQPVPPRGAGSGNN
jgi:hypothetical protein